MTTASSHEKVKVVSGDYVHQAFNDVFLALEDSGFAGNLRFLDILPCVLGKILSF